MLVGPSKWLKQKIQIKQLTGLRIPQLAGGKPAGSGYKPGRGFEFGTTVTKSGYRSEHGQLGQLGASAASPILLALRPFFSLLFLHCCDCRARKTQNIQAILPQFDQPTANV